jgi:hypothetical protein
MVAFPVISIADTSGVHAVFECVSIFRTVAFFIQYCEPFWMAMFLQNHAAVGCGNGGMPCV